MRSATDGEFRRAMWHFDFLEHPDGVESFRSDHGIAFKGGIETQAKGLRVTGPIGFSGHPCWITSASCATTLARCRR